MMIQAVLHTEIDLTAHEILVMTYIKKFTQVIVLWFSVSGAYAGMVPTAQFGAQAEPARLAQTVDQRENIRQQLIELGVDPVEARQRVDHMTDQQIVALQGKIAELPAGGVGTTNLLLIIIILILLL